ncbi:MAG: hypothetical protein GY749_40040 [Desulfobacteraceae bacterium]|nr:hypothetical protein [Desulfobacteraceae bacterium]
MKVGKYLVIVVVAFMIALAAHYFQVVSIPGFDMFFPEMTAYKFHEEKQSE